MKLLIKFRNCSTYVVILKAYAYFLFFEHKISFMFPYRRMCQYRQICQYRRICKYRRNCRRYCPPVITWTIISWYITTWRITNMSSIRFWVKIDHAGIRDSFYGGWGLLWFNHSLGGSIVNFVCSENWNPILRLYKKIFCAKFCEFIHVFMSFYKYL